MTTARPRLLITRRLPEAVLQAAERSFMVTVWLHDRPIADALDEWAERHDAVFLMATDRLDAARIASLHSGGVKAIGTYSVGHEHIDLDAASRLGMPVFYTPGVLSDAVAETAMFLVLAAARGTTAAEHVLRSGRWGAWSPTAFLGRQLTGLRLGIFGMGGIGSALARMARGFGMRVHYHNRSRLPSGEESGAIYHATLEDLVSSSDALCVCAPSTPETRGSINAERIALLPRGAIFVNVARGDLVDEQALIAAIEAGHIAAGLDVFANEPHIDARFKALPRTTLLPHIGSATETARTEMGLIVLKALESFLSSGKCEANCLNFQGLRLCGEQLS
jgi:lactate dehydrogenase-like 2-hydroxyacid dehydrogenase